MCEANKGDNGVACAPTTKTDKINAGPEQCHLYMAPSTLGVANMGMYTGVPLEKDEGTFTLYYILLLGVWFWMLPNITSLRRGKKQDFLFAVGDLERTCFDDNSLV